MASTPMYRPIDGSDAIRLLRLLKGSRYCDNDPVHCELFEAPLPDDGDDDTYYDALSYTWGDASDIDTIIVDGRPATVTANLRQALWYLRQADEDRILWVDAVCINQDDKAERTHQVGRMGTIYKKAREVIIWLGTTTTEVEYLLDTIELLDKKLLRISKSSARNPNATLMWLGQARLVTADLASSNPGVYEIRAKGLRDLLGRSWWRRVWVIQEAANARKASIQCSWRSVATRTLAFMPELLRINAGPHVQALLEVMPGPMRDQSWWQKNRSLETLLGKFQMSHSKEECDQVNALLGLSSDAGIPGCPMQADYTLDMTRVIQNTTSFLIFGNTFDPESLPLPNWSLATFRLHLPRLRSALLEWAMKEHHVPLVRKLLRSDPPCVRVNDPLRTRGQVGQTPLLLAISIAGSASLVEALLECEDLDVNLAGHNSTPLGLAASNGRVDLIRLLSTRPELNLRQRDNGGFSPIEVAIRNNQKEAFDALVALDGELGRDESGSLLHFSVEKNHLSMVQMLLAREDVNVNIACPPYTPLTLAVSLGHDDIVRLLLAQTGLRIRARDWEGYSALDRAFLHNRETIAYLLLTLDDEPLDDQLLSKYDMLLNMAAGKGWARIAHALLGRGANPDAKAVEAGYQGTPLLQAISHRHNGVTRVLLEAGADPDLVLQPRYCKESAWCPIVCAIETGSIHVLCTLLDTGRGASVEATEAMDEAPLIHAIRRSHIDMIKLLIDRGADLGARSAEWKMPAFWLAVFFNAPTIMRLLADNGADLSEYPGPHPHVFPGEWTLVETPWYKEFIRERQVSGMDVWRKEGIKVRDPFECPCTDGRRTPCRGGQTSFR